MTGNHAPYAVRHPRRWYAFMFVDAALAALLAVSLTAPTVGAVSATRQPLSERANAQVDRQDSAAPGNRRGIQVSPAIQNLTLEEGQAEASFQFSLTNLGATAQEVSLSALDFGALDESGGVAFIGRTGTQSRYSLSGWLRFSADIITLEPDVKQTLTARIPNREDLGPGGHYGAIVVSPTDTSGGGGENKVQIVPSTSVLVFLNKTGGETYGLKLDRLNVAGGLGRFPPEVRLRFQNAGNVHVVPRGTITITDTFGRQAAKGTINQESGIILPESFRQYVVALKRQRALLWPGQYTIVAEYRFDGSDELQTVRQTYLYLTPLTFIAALALAVAGAGIVWRLRRRRARKRARQATASDTANPVKRRGLRKRRTPPSDPPVPPA